MVCYDVLRAFYDPLTSFAQGLQAATNVMKYLGLLDRVMFPIILNTHTSHALRQLELELLPRTL